MLRELSICSEPLGGTPCSPGGACDPDVPCGDLAEPCFSIGSCLETGPWKSPSPAPPHAAVLPQVG